MVCVDTDFIRDLVLREPSAIRKLEEFVENGETIYTTAIAGLELCKSAFNTNTPDQTFRRIREFLENIDVLSVDLAAAERFGKLVNSEELKSRPIGDLNLITACIAIENNENFLTRNLEMFSRVPNLSLDTW